MKTLVILTSLFHILMFNEQDAQIVKGYFCNQQQHAVEFIVTKRQVHNEIIAADIVNKINKEFSCAYYMSVKAVQTGSRTVLINGNTVTIGSFLFFPEKTVKWAEVTGIEPPIYNDL